MHLMTFELDPYTQERVFPEPYLYLCQIKSVWAPDTFGIFHLSNFILIRTFTIVNKDTL